MRRIKIIRDKDAPSVSTTCSGGKLGGKKVSAIHIARHVSMQKELALQFKVQPRRKFTGLLK